MGGGDNWAYYSYLPALFIHKDLDNLNQTYEARNRIYNTTPNPANMHNRIGEVPDVPNGNRVIKYTMGVALLQAPFFLTAHGFQKITGGNTGGFEFPYVLAVFFSVLFYVFLGLFFLQKALLRCFNPQIIFWVLIAIFFGTNLFYFTSFNIGMSHAYLFFLYCLLIYSTPLFYEKTNWGNAVLLGFAVGMISLIRPAEALCVFIPALYGLGDKKSWWERIQFIKQNRKFIFLTAFVILLVPLPQFIYWKAMTGHWLYDSYPGEHFDFKHPQLIRGLFGWKNGWLSYTPIMFLVFPGLYFMWKNKQPLRLPVSIILPLIFILFTAGGAGNTPMVMGPAPWLKPMAFFALL